MPTFLAFPFASLGYFLALVPTSLVFSPFRWDVFLRLYQLFLLFLLRRWVRYSVLYQLLLFFLSLVGFLTQFYTNFLAPFFISLVPFYLCNRLSIQPSTRLNFSKLIVTISSLCYTYLVTFFILFQRFLIDSIYLKILL